MLKVFLDSSVLVAASASKTGGSALILDYSRRGKIQGWVSKETINEAEKNVNLKLGKEGKKRLAYYLKFANLFLASSPTLEETAKAEEVIYVKDAPIFNKLEFATANESF